MTKGIGSWGWQTVPQRHMKGMQIRYTQAKVIGGGSSINAQLYTRGNAQDYDDWADAGAEGWDWNSVLPYFRRSERNSRGADALQVVSPRTYHLLEHRWMDGLYLWYVNSVQRRLAEFVAFLDLLIINGVAVRWIGGGVPAVLGYLTGRSFHRGQARAYALWIVIGSLFLAWFLIAR